MKLKRLFIFALVFVVAFSFVACSKDKKTNNSNEFDGPEWNNDPVEVPLAMEQSNDPHAQMAVSYVAMANSFGSYGGLFAPPRGAICTVNRDEEWTYTWGDGELSITLVITETSTHYHWEIYFDGFDGNMTYDNFLYIAAEQTLDGSSGSMTLYDPEMTEFLLFWQWSSDDNGVYHFMYEFYQEGKIVVEINPDGSGFLEYYEYDNSAYWRSFRIEWTALGTGEWWGFDVLGNQIGYGLF